MESYSLKYYKEIINSGDFPIRFEIHEKDYMDNPKEIGEMVSCRLRIDGDDSPLSPITKTICEFSMVDTADIPDTALMKHGNWGEFFTPDSTKYLVKIFHDGDIIWSGYITPDNYTESLDYRGLVTISARDNIGHLQDFEFDLVTSTGQCSINDLISYAEEKIAYPMTLRNLIDGNNQIDWIQFESGTKLGQMLLNLNQFKDKNWYEVMESVLSSFGLVWRYVGYNASEITTYRFTPNTSRGGLQSLFDIEAFIAGSGSRTFEPGYRKITERITYNKSEYDVDIYKGSNTSTNNTLSYYASYYSSLNNQTKNDWLCHYAMSNNPEGSLGWHGALYSAEGKNIIARWLASSYETIPASEKGVWIPCGISFTNDSITRYNLGQIRMGGFSIICNVSNAYYKWGNEMMPSPGYEQEGMSCELGFRIVFERSDSGYYYFVKNEGWKTTMPGFSWDLAEYDESNKQYSIHIPSLPPNVTGNVVIEFDTSRTTARFVVSPSYPDFAMYISSIELEMGEMDSLQTHTVNTINNESYNVLFTRDPDVAILSQIVPIVNKDTYENALWDSATNSPTEIKCRWVEYASQPTNELKPFYTLLHQQILMYYHTPEIRLEGDFISGNVPVYFANDIQYKGVNYILLSGVWDVFEDRMEGAVLRSWTPYTTLWND